uniref:Uncharacterized protein n=1 Tax=Tetradesmus obliquus TaxID=3088 RepID=A0A383VWU0_TETOB|eukprot:jgi/Sobl393_1/13315/SZX69282.1
MLQGLKLGAAAQQASSGSDCSHPAAASSSGSYGYPAAASSSGSYGYPAAASSSGGYGYPAAAGSSGGYGYPAAASSSGGYGYPGVAPRLGRCSEAYARLQQSSRWSQKQAQAVQQLQQQQQQPPVAAAGSYMQRPQPLYAATPHTLFLPPAGQDVAAAYAAVPATASTQYQAAAGMQGQPLISFPATPTAAQQQQANSSGQQQPPFGFYTGAAGTAVYMPGAAHFEASKQQPTWSVPASPQALAAAAETRSRSKVKPYELKSFTVADPVEADPNTQAGGRLAPGSAPAAEPQQPTGAVAALQQALVRGLNSMLEELKQLGPLAAAAQQQACASTAAAAAAAAAATNLDAQDAAACSSSSSYSARYEQQQGCGSQVQGSCESGSSACSPMQAALAAKPLFRLPRFDYASDLRSLTRLARISRPASGQRPFVSLQLQDGKIVVPNITAADNGCNLLLLTLLCCEELGIPWHRMSVPELQAIDGQVRPSIIGRTVPFMLRLTPEEGPQLEIPVTLGACVMEGDAGGLFDMCLDTETLKPYYAFVHPLLKHLVWYPGAPQGDCSVMAGVPVETCYAGTGSAAVQLARHGIAAHAVPPGMAATLNSRSGSVSHSNGAQAAESSSNGVDAATGTGSSSMAAATSSAQPALHHSVTSGPPGPSRWYGVDSRSNGLRAAESSSYGYAAATGSSSQAAATSSRQPLLHCCGPPAPAFVTYRMQPVQRATAEMATAEFVTCSNTAASGESAPESAAAGATVPPAAVSKDSGNSSGAPSLAAQQRAKSRAKRRARRHAKRRARRRHAPASMGAGGRASRNRKRRSIKQVLQEQALPAVQGPLHQASQYTLQQVYGNPTHRCGDCGKPQWLTQHGPMASCGCSTKVAPVPPLHYCSAVLGLVLALLAGLHYWMLHVPSMGFSSWCARKLLAAASKPVVVEKPAEPPDIPMSGNQQQHSGRLSGKRKRGRMRHPAPPEQPVRVSVSISSVLARMLLFVWLCMLCSCSSVAAVQVSGSMMGHLAAGVQQVQLQPPTILPAYLSRQQAMQLLGWELGNLSGRRFCSRKPTVRFRRA